MCVCVFLIVCYLETATVRRSECDLDCATVGKSEVSYEILMRFYVGFMFTDLVCL